MKPTTEIPLPFAVFKVTRAKGLAKQDVIGRLATANDAVWYAKNVYKALGDSVESVRVWDTDAMQEIANFI